MDPILKVKDLCTVFKQGADRFKAVDCVNFELHSGHILGLVGESGSGKSATALSLMRLLPPIAETIEGKVELGDLDLLQLKEAEMRKIRGNRISMIFQEPMTSLNPVFSVGHQISEVFRIHQGFSRRQAKEATIDLLLQVGIAAPEKRFKEYPHQLSGGMRQRVMIAMALGCKPNVLIADEPTTALDVTIQAQILELILDIKAQHKMATLFITHDLGVVAELCDDVAIMYAGKIVEIGSVYEVFNNPIHPYTQGLLESTPKIGLKTERLKSISGVVPSLKNLPTGCRFHNRCAYSTVMCSQNEPKESRVTHTHQVSCFLIHSNPLGELRGETNTQINCS